ncbi:hypothetical protein [Plastoroseomonas hellenica]|uniref:hypothetical protein n=1 Tax=Plastoroseomonas hellenica TaxID=2687306 RepID=UPI001BAB9409|nr:hypothetical protein [Plastoroseomonas hellenica]MBR0641243.1 hypothetical protein [Plastoroseomonas hellenica]
MQRTPLHACAHTSARATRTPSSPQELDPGCIASARRWQAEADLLREMAGNPRLTARQSAALLRQADAAARQADWWLGATNP